MAEQKVATEAVETAEKVEAKTPTPETTEADAPAPEVKQPTPVAAAKSGAQAEPAVKPAKPAKAKPARKPAKAARARPARKPAKAAQSKPARKPAVSKTRKPARAGARQIEGVKTMTRKTNDTRQFAAEQFNNVFGDVNERAKAAVERSAKIVEELADLTRGNVEAFVASSKVAAKGVETLSQDAAEYGRKSFEEASAALKGFAEEKSAPVFFRPQGDYARGAFDSAVAETARLSETMLKFAGDVAEPITSRYTVAAERVKTLAA
mgnify:FL=1